jgi:hypothetical protein
MARAKVEITTIVCIISYSHQRVGSENRHPRLEWLIDGLAVQCAGWEGKASSRGRHAANFGMH